MGDAFVDFGGARSTMEEMHAGGGIVSGEPGGRAPAWIRIGVRAAPRSVDSPRTRASCIRSSSH